MPDPWEQQPNESTPAFRGFAVYRDMLPKRSLARTWRDQGKSQATVEAWSKRYHWVMRARAWDAHLDDAKRQAQKDAIAEMASRHANIAKLASARVLQRLLAMVDPKKPNELLENFDLREVARLLDVAVKVERLSRGANTEAVELTGKDGGAIQHEHDMAQSASERLARLIGGIVDPAAEDGVVPKP